MALARKEDLEQSPKNEISSIYAPATDAQAVKVREATAKVHHLKANGNELNGPTRTFVRVPLLLTRAEEAAVRKLIQGPEWLSEQQKVIALLLKLSAKLAVAEHDAVEGEINGKRYENTAN